MTIRKKYKYYIAKKQSIAILSLLCLLILPINLTAKSYLSLSYNKNGKTYQNNAKVFDLESHNETVDVDLGESYKYPGEFIKLKDTSHRYYYQQTSKIDATIKVFDTKTFTLKHTYNINHKDYIIHESQAKLFVDLSPDFSKFYIQTKYKKSTNIMVFDNQTGELLKQLKLQKGRSYSELSQNGEFIITHYISKRTVSIFDANNYKKISDLTLKTSRKLRANYKDYVFTNVHIKHRNKKAYRIDILNVKTLEKISAGIIAKGEPIYFHNKKTDKFYIAARDVKSSKLIFVEFLEGTIINIDTQNIHQNPKGIVSHNGTENLLILGNKKNVLIDINHPENSITMKQPFDIGNIIWLPEFNRLYLREGTGSVVALFDTQTGKKLGKSATGRAGVKLGQFMVTVAAAYVGYGYGYMPIVYSLSSTQMMLNANEDKLYVINYKTNDVTQLDAATLKGRKALATGRATSMLYQHEDNVDNLLVLSAKKASFINDKDFTMIKQIKFDQLVGLDLVESVLFVKQQDVVNAYSMIDGGFLSKLSVNPNVGFIEPLALGF